METDIALADDVGNNFAAFRDEIRQSVKSRFFDGPYGRGRCDQKQKEKNPTETKRSGSAIEATAMAGRPKARRRAGVIGIRFELPMDRIDGGHCAVG